MMSVIKLFLFTLLVATASALDCFYCKSDDYGNKCVKNDTSQWTVMTCPPTEKACFIRLQRNTRDDSEGIAERGCAENLDFCRDLLGPLGVSFRYYESCGICNVAKCNNISALDISSSMRNSLNVPLLLLSLLMIVKRIFMG
ncbi:uncharacterized protein LOC132261541 [Phlebotomus argentipes]|uniref:uncharacterized protein LOC132261541 n=1 Tax=Phlebotomus argentipes TaxID=94469 RepID=UPI002893812D|nr:uncharacterized protein LOC132261541 [Phlebotomus argentipes]XP_059616375.1 uncharacterized protein LOC132261541 [Phlebotomus argentipes]